jgi:D-alanyl-lipoteichoic acid acyltransferase DltB (MBOAT superfamily)
MIFNSGTFLIFLLIVLLVYYTLAHKAQNAWLLAASCLFYGWWDYRFLGLMGFSAFIDYFAAIAISNTEAPQKRRRLLLLSLFVNFGILGFFKYFNFFVDTGVAFLSQLGFEPHRPTLEIILPVGSRSTPFRRSLIPSMFTKKSCQHATTQSTTRYILPTSHSSSQGLSREPQRSCRRCYHLERWAGSTFKRERSDV